MAEMGHWEDISPKKLDQKPRREGQFTDPIFKKLSLINGEINKMSRDQLIRKCKDLRLDTKGVNDVLRKRLKRHYKERKLMKSKCRPSATSTSYDYLLVIDFEATCEKDNAFFQHEIIEFPVVLIDVQKMEVIDEFQSYCKPRLNPMLSDFCTELTGISQNKVSEAPEFPTVISMVNDWLKAHKLGQPGYKFAAVTDGPWDMCKFLCHQCKLNNIPYPKWAKKWINVRKTYSNYYQCRRKNLQDMLIFLGLEFVGHQHCGLDDSRNIARIVIHLLKDGCNIHVNEWLHVQDSGLTFYDPLAETAGQESSSDPEEELDRTCKGIGDSIVAKQLQNTPLEQDFGKLSLDSKGDSSCRNIKVWCGNRDKGDNSFQEVTEDEEEDLLFYYKLQKS